MPRREREARANKNVTLKEALNWVAFDNFNGPPASTYELQMQITGDVMDLEGYEYEVFCRAQQLKDAEDDLFAALRDGDIKSYGRFSNQSASNSVATNWHEQKYINHSDTQDEIPTNFWRQEGIDWNGNQTKSSNSEYTDIILIREEVLAIWQLEETEEEEGTKSSGEISGGRSGQKRGRKQQYPVEEFLGLCVLDADANELPKTQADFVDRMAKLLAIIWGEDAAPADTWLKSKISPIYKLREKYEAGRQKLEDG